MELLTCSLKDYIKGFEPSLLSFYVQLSLDRDIASALVFLHLKSIVHRDLCEDNVLLLIEDGRQIPVAKVSDFGMSRMLDLEQMSISLSSVRHRTAYLPPEVLIDPKSYDASIDIFMFGVVMVQIAHSVSKVDTIDKRKELLRTIPDSHPLKSPVDLFELCVKDVKEDRPTAQKVYEIIDNIFRKYGF
jgi:serine/threonine protein kinase